MSEIIAIAAFRIQNPIEAPFRALAAWHRRYQSVKALNKLTARELEDIGIVRGDIPSFAKRICA